MDRNTTRKRERERVLCVRKWQQLRVALGDMSDALREAFPEGCRVEFTWRSGQLTRSTGVVVGHWADHGAINVRNDATPADTKRYGVYRPQKVHTVHFSTVWRVD